MKLLIVFAVVLAVSATQFVGYDSQTRWITRPTIAAPRPPPKLIATNRVASSDQAAEVTRYDNEAYPDGSYNYNLQTSNGIVAQAQGTPRNLGGYPPVAPVVSQGSFSWTSPEGQLIDIKYVADENGYQPSGDAIPTPPPAGDVEMSITNATNNYKNSKALSRIQPVGTYRVASSDQAAEVTRYDNEPYSDGSYNYNPQISNGIVVQAQGTPRYFGGYPPVVPIVSQGSFSWPYPKGQLILIKHVADEKRYQSSGDAIPTPPPAGDIETSITNATDNYQNSNALSRIQPVATYRVASRNQVAEVTRYDNEPYSDGSYNYNPQISNGIVIQAQGTPRYFGGYPPVVPIVSQGSFSWPYPKGQLILIKHVADEKRYQSSGNVMTTTPPPPSDIANAVSSVQMQRMQSMNQTEN